MPTLSIDGHSIDYREGETILEAADRASVYIPRLCHHPDLPPAGEIVWTDGVFQLETYVRGEQTGAQGGDDAHCNLCCVEIDGEDEPVHACRRAAEPDLVIRSASGQLTERRRRALRGILQDHPHACLTCAQKEGCSRTNCSANVPESERCCTLLGRCELEKVSDYIGIPADTPRYVPQNRPVAKDDPLFIRDYNLCIGCLRCVRVCEDLRMADVLAAVWAEERVWVGTRAKGGLREADCRYCGACVEVCPTGALLDRDDSSSRAVETDPPCVRTCPLGIDIPRYIRLVALGRYDDALRLIRARAPFPGLLGHVCYHPCEDHCRRGELDQPIAICALKRFAAEAATPDAFGLPEVSPDTGKSVAIIGSGPSGLTAAYYLRVLGHRVEIFDDAQKPGGMLRQVIPGYRLPETVLDAEFEVLDVMGIRIHAGQRLGDHISLADLHERGFDAVLLATGTARSKSLPIEGSDLEGIHAGLEFLRAARQAHAPRLDGRIVVIGGGSVAVDAAMTALRLGASEVGLVCLESRDAMPAHPAELKQAEEEGVAVMAGWGPARFAAEADRVTGVDLVRCTCVFDAQGRFNPAYDIQETRHIPADHVIVTIGQTVDPTLFGAVPGLTPAPGGAVQVSERFVAGPDGLFAAGDMTRGPTSVVQAMADGRRVAESIDRYLGGSGQVDDATACDGMNDHRLISSAEAMHRTRQPVRTADPGERKAGFDLIDGSYTKEAAEQEAERCLQCHLRGLLTPVVLPPERWLRLCAEAVENVPADAGVLQLLDAEKEVLRIWGTADMQHSLTECLDAPGSVAYFSWEAAPLFTKRESELIQKYVQAHGEMPGGGVGGDDLDDLF